jgi:hypothetical protein
LAARPVVQPQQADRAASLRLVLKGAIWAALFVGLFTLHAHLNLRAAMLRAETSRLQGDVQALREEHKALTMDLMEARQSGALQRNAEQILGMVPAVPSLLLQVSADARREVKEGAGMWRRGSQPQDTAATYSQGVIEILAGMIAGPRTAG